MLAYKELKNGFDLTLENARDLFNEAKGLAIFEHYSRAYTLYQLSIEEVGKCIILLRALIEGSLGVNIDSHYLRLLGYFDHQSKTRTSLWAESVMLKFFEQSTGHDITEFLKELEYDALHVKDINALKSESLYVGFNGNKFVAPKSVITKEMVDDIAFKADIRIHAIIPMFPTEEQLDEIVEFFKQNENE